MSLARLEYGWVVAETSKARLNVSEGFCGHNQFPGLFSEDGSQKKKHKEVSQPLHRGGHVAKQ